MYKTHNIFKAISLYSFYFLQQAIDNSKEYCNEISELPGQEVSIPSSEKWFKYHKTIVSIT